MKKQAQEQVQEVQTKTVTMDEQVQAILDALCKGNKNISLKAVTGYTGIKFGNNVLCEYHIKKRGISHITFGSESIIYDTLKKADVIREVKPKSYGWRLDTECLLSKELIKILPQLLQTLIDEQQAKAVKKEEKQTKKEVVA